MKEQSRGVSPRNTAPTPRMPEEQSRGVSPRNAAVRPRNARLRIVEHSHSDSNPTRPDSAVELSDNLGALHTLLKQLADQADAKLAALRAADASALQTCAARETELLQHVARNAQERQAIVARLAQHLPPSLPNEMPLSELIEKFPEPQASILRARSLALRESARKLQEKNSLAARVAHHLQSHIRAVFAELAKVNQESVVYGPKGQHEQAALRSCLDAVG
jgi:flagellar biosynthesis/type III secretory pathway chaperone